MDCEYFPATCTDEVLCPNGPFDPSNPATSLDRRTEIFVIRGRSPSDVWVAGAVGAVAHFDGTSWKRSELGTQETQRTLWLGDSWEMSFGSPMSLYTRGLELDAGGTDAGITADGWSPPVAPALPAGFDRYGTKLRASWSSPGSDTLWLAMISSSWSSGLWRLRNASSSSFEIVEGIPPSACQDVPCTRMLAIHGASPSTLWAVGELGATIRVSGADGDTPTAKPFNSQTSNALKGVWAASDSDVWSVGAEGAIRHYRGDPHSWDVVADVPTKVSLNGVWGTSASDIWAVGDAGVVLHYDGKTWERIQIAGLGSLRPNLYSVWSPGLGHVWIAGQGVVVSLGGKP
ncbi:hypothetical protein AKJ09_09970 [Labilithrix luteola]|uniref:Type IV fimbrial biogenesis protein PilY1 n=1 Tax=Labilithrix luteola TaxID=1391654 RepID=A0A0K1QCC7_9BACT|nr:hypothetical protein AKJ09_09970 [Labilithrix luteola]